MKFPFIRLCKWKLILISLFLFTSCKDNNGGSSEQKKQQQSIYSNGSNLSSEQYDSDVDANEERTDNSGDVEDGEYTAEVEYYNPNTGTRSVYDLEVEVDGNTVTKIHFNNGGWIDESHIVSGGELDNGTTTIIDDRGYEYTVTIDN